VLFRSMALTVADCKAIEDAVRKAGVKFCISFPHRTNPANLFAKQIADEGLLGDITLMRVRNAHNGATGNWLPPHFYDPVACGGGAMIDLGAHPMYLSRWIMGAPKAISASFTYVTGKPVEDNAVAVVEFEKGGIAIVETGFVTSNSPFVLELHGTEGALFVGGADGKVKVNSSKLNGKVSGWVDANHMPKGLPSAIEQWVKGILEGTPIVFGLEDGTQLTELMEGAYISHREGRKVQFPLA
jgi:1,5-anhydro-D-fructose reductase (1,5-anhydro-D-mannitol-forming)